MPELRLLCLVLTLTTSDDTQGLTTAMPGVVGWEKNDKGQFGPRRNSVDLNLKLMK